MAEIVFPYICGSLYRYKGKQAGKRSRSNTKAPVGF